MKQTINKRDLQIISELRKNARMSLTNLSKSTKIPISTLFDRIKTNQSIVRHTSIIDFCSLGFNTRVNILLKVHKKDRTAALAFLNKNHNVNSLFRINNGYDFLVEGIFKDIKEVEFFIESMEDQFNILDSRTHFVVKDHKREAFLSDLSIF